MKRIILFLLIPVFFICCDKEDKNDGKRKVILKSDSGWYIQYIINGKRSVVNSAPNPWRYEYDADKGDKIELIVESHYGGRTTATILLNENVVGSCDSGSGSYCTATATIK